MEDVIVVMSDRTWNEFKNKEFDVASKQDNPIEYIIELSKINIEIDNGIPFGGVELWERKKYETFQRLKKMGKKDENNEKNNKNDKE